MESAVSTMAKSLARCLSLTPLLQAIPRFTFRLLGESTYSNLVPVFAAS